MTSLRWLKNEFREFPATMSLGTLWVVVFLAMVLDQWYHGGGLTTGRLVLGLRNGHRFGAMTVRELYHGELWRALTSTFVHYGLLHIAMNLWAYYQLGCLIESWYGPGSSVAIYVVTGGGGNLVSGLIRHALGSDPRIESGGGSVVVMGLVGLCAVVGWKARSRIGNHLRNQMVWILVLTAGMGFGLTFLGIPVIDNWGHTGGALMGILVGFGNTWLVRGARSRLARLAGGCGALLIGASALAQVADSQNEAAEQPRIAVDVNRLFVIERAVRGLDEIREVYARVALGRAIGRGTVVRERPTRAAAPPPSTTETPAPNPAPAVPQPLRIDFEREYYLNVVASLAKWFNALAPFLDTGENSADFQRVRTLMVQSIVEPPTREEVREAVDRLHAIRARLMAERDQIQRELLRREQE